LLKQLIDGLATLLVLPAVGLHHLVGAVLGPNAALETGSQWMALMPGLLGVFLRRAYLRLTLQKCHRTADVRFGVLFSQTGAVIEENVYVGPRCHLGLVHLERDCLIAAGVHIPSGGKTHYFDDPNVPIRDQGGERGVVRIGAGAWIGSAAIVLADVGAGTIVGAGSVVTKPLPANVIAVGNPAKVLRPRFPSDLVQQPETKQDG
ncbi:MAG: acyltransferase, partial [Gemmataceae bacterium]